MTLKELGWNPDFENAFAPHRAKGRVPARLIRESPINFGAFLDGGEEIDVVLCGRVWHEATCDADLPAVGDWVALELGNENQDHVIRATLPRKTCFSRKMPGNSSQAQVIGANIDFVAVVTDAGPDFNLRRMERYFMLIERSGAKAVVLVNKSDLFPKEQNEQAAAEIAALWDGATVHITSAIKGEGPMPGSNFDYAASLTEMAHVGVLAQRTGREIVYNAATMELTNHDDLGELIREPARVGWDFGREVWR